MSAEETVKTIQARLDVLKKSLVSEENSVQYYQTLIGKTPQDTEENVGTYRMYEDLHEEEKKHVKTIQDLLIYWEKQLESIKNNPPPS
jgi:rubrerythrin